MKIKHTPGPWGCNGLPKDEIDIEAHDEPLRVIATVKRNSTNISAMEAVANVDLIMAAPDLLEACRAMLGVCEKSLADLTPYAQQLLKPTVDKWKAAIAKAEGSTK